MNAEELISLSREVKFSDGGRREITPLEAEKLLKFVELLSKWSEKMSLVSSSAAVRIINEHILDCWAAFAFVPRETIYLDIGSGSGLPGIVFSILSPLSKVILLEPRVKRIDFLKESRRVLKLENIETAHTRLEDWKGLEGGQTKDTSLAAIERAVGMEAEIYRLLKAKVASFSFSTMVSMTWSNPLSNTTHTASSYKLPNGNTHQVVCFT
jgi:16S rRNA (guanine(527)-N(7))-methyltransferase RsmG